MQTASHIQILSWHYNCMLYCTALALALQGRGAALARQTVQQLPIHFSSFQYSSQQLLLLVHSALLCIRSHTCRCSCTADKCCSFQLDVCGTVLNSCCWWCTAIGSAFAPLILAAAAARQTVEQLPTQFQAVAAADAQHIALHSRSYVPLLLHSKQFSSFQHSSKQLLLLVHSTLLCICSHTCRCCCTANSLAASSTVPSSCCC